MPLILQRPTYHILTAPDQEAMQLIEAAGRTCYKSESRITDESLRPFLEMIVRRGHLSVIEHASMTVRLVVDRGVSHELCRHRLCAISQESTRYCSYRGGVTFIVPPWVKIEAGEYDSEHLYHNLCAEWSKTDQEWFGAMADAANSYETLLREGWSPQQARAVLPNSLKTELVVTANLREWRHIFSLRTSPAAHPQMREVMVPLLNAARIFVPVVFDDLE